MHLTVPDMTRMTLRDGAALALRVDDFTLPWDAGLPVVMLHGLAESGEAFRRWVPTFAARHRVVRPDLRGYGQSTPMRPDYEYRFTELGRDVLEVIDALDIERACLIGAKIGGALAMHLAATFPDRVAAVAAVGAPASLTSFAERAPAWRERIREQGVEPWVRETTTGRLGSSLSPAAVEWWVELMSRTSADTMEAFLRMVPTVDVRPELPRIRCPVLVITTAGSGLGSVSDVSAWQETIPGSRLEVLPGNSYHVAATDPDVCSALTLKFLEQIR